MTDLLHEKDNRHSVRETSDEPVFDEESDREPPKTPVSKEPLKSIRWGIATTIFISFLSLMAMVAFCIYLRISNQSKEDETKAARGVADVAMAMTYAQFKQVQPQNQNWSYSKLIKTNLRAILPHDSGSLANIDIHGQFIDFPYMLRIYESNKQPYFVVIAQPKRESFYSFMPQASIAIDSRSLELHKIQDLKALNRLLVDSKNLDGINIDEISSIIQQGELIPLNRLADENKKEFVPPKALGMMRPGADNKIYNAPRYYLFGEILLESAIALTHFQQEIKNKPRETEEVLAAIAKFPDFIFYSSAGIEHTLELRETLATIKPNEKFLLA